MKKEKSFDEFFIIVMKTSINLVLSFIADGLSLLSRLECTKRFIDVCNPICDMTKRSQMDKSHIQHNLGESWHNRCWYKDAPRYVVDLGSTFGRFFNVLNIGDLTTCLIMLILHTNVKGKEQFLEGLFFLHRLMLVPLCTIVGLYLIFKQRRPCYNCNTQCCLGCVYGMPSGDSLAAGACGVALSQLCFPLGLLLIVAIPFSRVVRGYHTVLQTFVGSMFGISSAIALQCLGPKYQIIHWVLAFVLPYLVLFDPNCAKQKKGDIYNLHAWLWSNSGFLFFDILVCAPKSIVILPNYDRTKVADFAFLLSTVLNIIMRYLALEGWSFYIDLSKKKDK